MVLELMIVAKAVAVQPTWTEPLAGSTAARSGEAVAALAAEREFWQLGPADGPLCATEPTVATGRNSTKAIVRRC